MNKCFYCDKQFGLFEDKYVIRKAIKPKGYPHRYIKIGYCCETCSHKEKFQINE